MRAQVGDGRLFFDVEGARLVADGPRMRERPTLLLLHGGPGADHSYFKPGYSHLSELAQVIYLDHRSAGRSDRTGPDRWTLDRWGDDVRAFCDALEIERPIVMGVSFGGMVAMAYATRHPDHPAKLVLCSTAARVDLARVAAVFERRGGRAAAEAALRFFRDPCAKNGADYFRLCMPLYSYLPDPNLAEMFARTVPNLELSAHYLRAIETSFNFLPDLLRIKCPTLVMAGEEDPVTPLADSEDIAAALPRELVRLERFAKAGHGIATDSPERFFKVLREFIGS
ncbi:MAG TPA: alpha/beta hydrolase [Candidatus Binataceae bacterium]|nr:alpha/beta hydrolase [Candidatus Binataceae bacterium]